MRGTKQLLLANWKDVPVLEKISLMGIILKFYI